MHVGAEGNTSVLLGARFRIIGLKRQFSGAILENERMRGKVDSQSGPIERKKRFNLTRNNYNFSYQLLCYLEHMIISLSINSM